MFHLGHCKLSGQHANVGKLGVELQGLHVRDVELGRQMHLHAHLTAVGHNGHIGSDDSTDARYASGINDLSHGIEVVIVNDGVDRQISLHVVLLADGNNVVQIIEREVIGAVRPHVELPHTEVYRVGTCLNGGRQTLARPHRGHDLKVFYSCVHAAKVLSFSYIAFLPPPG